MNARQKAFGLLATLFIETSRGIPGRNLTKEEIERAGSKIEEVFSRIMDQYDKDRAQEHARE